MLQTYLQKRRAVAELLHCAERLAKCIECRQVDDHLLDIAWNLLHRHAKSRRLLKEFNALLPEALEKAPRTSKGYRLCDEQVEHLAQAKQTFELRAYALSVELAELAESRLKRDLEALNEWWKHCSAEERDIAFSAIASATGANKPARLLSAAKGEKRIMLLALGMEAVELVYKQARVQAAKWKALNDKDQRKVMKSIHTHTGMDPNEWWSRATIIERTKVLKELLGVLEDAEEAKKALKKSKTGTA
ncbi:MAG: hypothetical protein P1P90_01620 [Patescibacteria group bacterium]|nr:hypothetical protein [Patescibacteria group bacterium]